MKIPQNAHIEIIEVFFWNDYLEVEVTFTYYGGCPQTYNQPADEPEISIYKVTDVETGIDLTDFMTSAKEEQIEKQLFELASRYAQEAEEVRAEYLFEQRRDERWGI